MCAFCHVVNIQVTLAAKYLNCRERRGAGAWQGRGAAGGAALRAVGAAEARSVANGTSHQRGARRWARHLHDGQVSIWRGAIPLGADEAVPRWNATGAVRLTEHLPWLLHLLLLCEARTDKPALSKVSFAPFFPRHLPCPSCVRLSWCSRPAGMGHVIMTARQCTFQQEESVAQQQQQPPGEAAPQSSGSSACGGGGGSDTRSASTHQRALLPDQAPAKLGAAAVVWDCRRDSGAISLLSTSGSPSEVLTWLNKGDTPKNACQHAWRTGSGCCWSELLSYAQLPACSCHSRKCLCEMPFWLGLKGLL